MTLREELRKDIFSQHAETCLKSCLLRHFVIKNVLNQRPRARGRGAGSRRRRCWMGCGIGCGRCCGRCCGRGCGIGCGIGLRKCRYNSHHGVFLWSRFMKHKMLHSLTVGNSQEGVYGHCLQMIVCAQLTGVRT